MGRPCSFDRDDVIRKAMTVFWDKGYASTSVQDLVEATGLQRGSLYNAFGDKAGLFDAVLMAYTADNPSTRFIRVAGTAPPKEAIHTLFNGLLEAALTFGEGRGCLVSSVLSARGEGAHECEKTIGDAYAALGRALKRAITRGQKDGSISRHHNAAALAHFLNSAVHGLSAGARSGMGPKALRDTVKVTLSALD